MSDLVVGTELVVEEWGRPPRRADWVVISGGRIEAIGTGTPPASDDRLESGRGIVIPGFVNAHHHLYQGASRGIRAPDDLIDWLGLHYRAWARLTEADIEAAAMLSLSLLALGGSTTVAAFEYLHPAGSDFVAPVLRAAERVGLRLLYVRGSATRLESALGERLAGEEVDVDRLVETDERALAATADVVSRSTTDRLRFACGPTTPVLDDGGDYHRALTAVADAAGVDMHLHYHPIDGTQLKGETAFDAAGRLGLVREGNWYAHGSRLTDADVAALGASGVGVVHAPSCSLLLDYPVPSLRAWSAVNERVAIAVDGAASNDRGMSLSEAQLAWQLQRALHGATGSPSAAQILRLATVGGAAAIGWPDLGRIEVGGPADLAVIDRSAVRLAGTPDLAAEDPAMLLMRTYSGERVRHTVVGDRVVVRDGELAGADEDAVAEAADAAASRLYDAGDRPLRVIS